MNGRKSRWAVCIQAMVASTLLLYSPPTPAPTLSQVESTPTPRKGHNLVAAQDGKTYAFLGKQPASGVFVAEVDVYDPRAGHWDTLISDSVPSGFRRAGATATVLQNGDILFVGGVDVSGNVIATTLIFDPRADQDTKWSIGPEMSFRRTRHGANLLKNGKVLIHGGAGCPGAGSCTEALASSLGSSEIFDPVTQTFLPPQMMPAGADRYDHTGILVGEGHDFLAGDVRVFGGFRGVVGGTHTALASTLLYSNGVWCYGAPLYSIQKGMRTIAPLLADGRIAIMGGTENGIIPVSGITLYDPQGFCGTEVVTSVAPPPGYIPRWGATANLLPDGNILIAGGNTSPTTAADSIQVLQFDGTNVVLNGMLAATPRTDHTATVMPTGEVLIVGGQNPDPGSPPPSPNVIVTEKYDPTDGRFCSLAPIGGTGSETPLRGSSSQLLPNGRVLVAFGNEATGNPTRRAFLFDPEAGTAGSCPDQPEGQWIPVADQPVSQGGSAADNGGVPRRRAPALLLDNGAVLVVGGEGGGGGGGGGISLDSVRIFNPEDPTAGPNGTWREASPMNHARRGHSATLLKDGRVLVAGGVDDSETVLDVWEIFDPRTNTWTDCTHLAPVRRYDHAAVLLPSGEVLVTGGRDEIGEPKSSTEHFDPGSDPFEGQVTMWPPMNTPRAGHTAILLPSGRVLVAFGDTASGPTNSSEVFNPGTAHWSPTEPAKESLQPRGKGHASVLMPNGKILSVAGIETAAPGAVEQEIFDPELNQWFPTATGDPLGTPWNDPAAVVVMLSGRALIAGGSLGTGFFSAPGTEVARSLDLNSLKRLQIRPGPPAISNAYEQGAGRMWCFRLRASDEGEGDHFGSREGAGGAGAQLSSSLPPQMSFVRVEGNVTVITPPRRNTWTDHTFGSTIPEDMLPGRYLLTITSAGISSDSKMVLVTPEYSPLNPDEDFDGFGALVDCDDADPLVWGRPGEVRDLLLSHDPSLGLTTLQWRAPLILGAGSLVYDSLRSGDPADFVTGGVCFESDDGLDTQAITTETPARGGSFFYLVRAQNGCPSGEGTLGNRWDGTERTGLPCP